MSLLEWDRAACWYKYCNLCIIVMFLAYSHPAVSPSLPFRTVGRNPAPLQIGRPPLSAIKPPIDPDVSKHKACWVKSPSYGHPLAHRTRLD